MWGVLKAVLPLLTVQEDSRRKRLAKRPQRVSEARMKGRAQPDGLRVAAWKSGRGSARFALPTQEDSAPDIVALAAERTGRMQGRPVERMQQVLAQKRSVVEPEQAERESGREWRSESSVTAPHLRHC